MNQKGFTSLALGIIIALFFILGGGLYYYIITQEKQSEQYTPQEVFTKEKDVEFNQEMKDKTTEKKLSGDEQKNNFLCIHPLNIQTNLPYDIYSYQKSVFGGYSITGERSLFLFDINNVNLTSDQLSDIQNDADPVQTNRVDIEVFSTPIGFIVLGERNLFFLNEDEALKGLLLDLIESFSYSSCDGMPLPRVVDLKLPTELAFEDWVSTLFSELKELYEVVYDMKKDTYLNPSKTNEKFFERDACYYNLMSELSLDSGPAMIADSLDSRKSYPIEDKHDFIKFQIKKLVEKELNIDYKNLDGKGVLWPPEPGLAKVSSNIFISACKNLNIPDKYK